MGSSHGAYNVDSRMPRTERVTMAVNTPDMASVRAASISSGSPLSKSSMVKAA